MLAFFGNLAPSEVLVLAVIAVLVFGKRLPEVASKGYTQMRRWRQSLDQLRRETGIDRELRDIQRSFREAEREARIDDLPRLTGPGGPPPPQPAAPPPPQPASEEAPAAGPPTAKAEDAD